MKSKKSRQVTLHRVKTVVVDCAPNCDVDIRCGGPQYVGYDFTVDVDLDDKEIRRQIAALLKKHQRPLVKIRLPGETESQKVWSWDQIEKEIKKNDVTAGVPYSNYSHYLSDEH